MSTPQRRHFEAEQVGDVTVATFLDRRILDEQLIQGVRDELVRLVDESTSRKVVLNFANVEFYSSAALGPLITLAKKLAAQGRSLRLCGIDLEVYEGFENARLDKFFIISGTVAEALTSFDRRYLISCPIQRCGGWAREMSPAQTCPECGVRFTIHAIRPPQAGGVEARVNSFTIGTYEGEHIIVELGQPVMLRVTGRLDLFASESLLKAWRTVPPPRRVVIDLRNATELSGAAATALQGLCGRGEDDSRTVILLSTDQQSRWMELGVHPFAHCDAAAAARALGNVDVERNRQILVNVRTEG
jgi:anti-sigma B factor antagonist